MNKQDPYHRRKAFKGKIKSDQKRDVFDMAIPYIMEMFSPITLYA